MAQIDRLFDWKAQTDAPIQQSLNSQKEHVKREFDERLKQSVLNLNEQGLNVALYWQNPDKRKYVNVVPTSAITGEGLPDMLQLLVDLTQVNTPSPPSIFWCIPLTYLWPPLCIAMHSNVYCSCSCWWTSPSYPPPRPHPQGADAYLWQATLVHSTVYLQLMSLSPGWCCCLPAPHYYDYYHHYHYHCCWPKC